MKNSIIKMQYIILIALTVFPLISQSLGINKTFKASVTHATLGGYVNTPQRVGIKTLYSGHTIPQVRSML